MAFCWLSFTYLAHHFLPQELEEFSKLLRKREKDLKAKSIRIENEYNKELSIQYVLYVNYLLSREVFLIILKNPV